VFELEFILITGRTIEQGCGKESGKLSKQYMENVAVCEMNSDDMKKLKVNDGSKVQVTTAYGSVVVKARKSRRIRTPGTVFIPYGLWANAVLSSSTDGTGMPLLKGMKATVEPTNMKFLELHDLLRQSFNKPEKSE
jgi:formylmethanofuran dehydrogenase subunit D